MAGLYYSNPVYSGGVIGGAVKRFQCVKSHWPIQQIHATIVYIGLYLVQQSSYTLVTLYTVHILPNMLLDYKPVFK